MHRSGVAKVRAKACGPGRGKCVLLAAKGMGRSRLIPVQERRQRLTAKYGIIKIDSISVICALY